MGVGERDRQRERERSTCRSFPQKVGVGEERGLEATQREQGREGGCSQNVGNRSSWQPSSYDFSLVVSQPAVSACLLVHIFHM